MPLGLPPLALPLALVAAVFLAVAPVPPAHAQGTALGFGGLRQNPDAPVEVTSDRFEVNQADGVAIFTGNVVVVQGELRLGAGAVRVEYGDGGSGIRRLHASGGVTLATSAEAAESREAVYTLASGELEMSGDVLVTQGAATIAGDRLVADLRAGTGRIEGRVKTVFRPGSGGGAAGGD